MTLTTMDKKPVQTVRTPWPADITAEFERERQNPNGCVGQRLVSENERARVWHISLKPGERLGFHRHVLDYFWSVLTAGRARAHMDDGSTVEHTYSPGETRHETHTAGHFKVHDLENIGDTELIFCTVEFLDSANKPLPVPDKVRAKF